MLWTRFSVLVLVLAVAACNNDQPCDGASSACVVVGVSSAFVPAIDGLELDIAYGDFHETSPVLSASGEAIELPVVTAIELAPDEAVIVSVVGAGLLGGSIVGVGYGETPPILDGHRAELALRLEPILPCVAGRSYCGGEYAPGHPESLYRCEPGRVPILIERCFDRCVAVAEADARCE